MDKCVFVSTGVGGQVYASDSKCGVIPGVCL